MSFPSTILVERDYMSKATSNVIVVCLDGDYLFRRGMYTELNARTVKIFIPADDIGEVTFWKKDGRQKVAEGEERQFRIKPFNIKLRQQYEKQQKELKQVSGF